MDSKTFFKLSYGLYLVTSKKGEQVNGQIANTVFQVSSEPPTIAVSINKQNLTHEYIESSKVLTVSVLDKETPLDFIGKFGFKSGKEVDKLAGIDYQAGRTGAPIVKENSLGYFEAMVINKLDVETHTIYVAKVIDAVTFRDEEPMTYAYYHEIKRGTTPKTAPTYSKEEKPKEIKKTGTYKCIICGYVYDPEIGDPDSGIAPGTPFADLPEDWVCPLCGAAKSAFEKVG